MHYIYDILVNFKNNLYDFYDWNKEDKILNIRKIPVIKVKENVLYDIVYYNVEFNDEFLEKIYNKTDLFHNIRFQILPYACIFTDGKKAFAFQIQKKNILISSLLFDEEEEIIDISRKINFMDISYKKISSRPLELETRKEIKKINFIKKELKKINQQELNYLYLECFNKKNIDQNRMIIDLNDSLEDRFLLNTIYDFIKLTLKMK